jgi:MFS superfamily sulfate permease-like transporter
MATINTIETESIQAGLAGIPPIATVDLWPSLSPTAPFSLQNWGTSNFQGMHNQIGIHNGIGGHFITGLASLIGAKTGVGGQVNAEPQNTNATLNGNLSGHWVYNGSEILTFATDYDSDMKLKKNIQPLQNSLDKVLQLKGVSFDWDETKVSGSGYVREGKKEFGFIAQDVENVFPDLVSDRNTSEDTTKMVKHKNLIAVLVEAMKEQQEQINSLKETVEELSTKLAECCS